ncbi:MAG: glycosyltransferase family 2 protein [Gaiellaceae bacterium]
MEFGGPGLAGLNGRNNGGGIPLVTVLVCTHNDEVTLPIALTSAIAQTAEPEAYRILVVDDGSTDGTRDEIERFRRRDPERLEVIRLEKNGGLVPACNEGLRRVRTPFYVRLDGDDRLDPELIEALLETSMLESANLVYTDRYEVHGDGSIKPRRLPPALDVGELIAAGTLLPSRLAREVGGYRKMFWEEFDLYLRLLESGRCRHAHVEHPLYTYTIGEPGRMTSDSGAVEAGWAELRERWPAEVLERYGLTRGLSGVPGRSAVAG